MDGFWVDGIDYETIFLHVSYFIRLRRQRLLWYFSAFYAFYRSSQKPGAQAAGCTSTGCFGGELTAYVVGKDPSTVVVSFPPSGFPTTIQLGTQRFACPYGEQIPVLTSSVCINPNGEVTAENVISLGLFVLGPVAFALFGDCPDSNRDYVTITIECS